ncbi:ABC transporter ATP-binding protein [Galenea microaerophila]
MFKVEKVSCPPYLAEVSFEVAAGQIITLMGASGVGKSVLLRALADLEPHQGEVWLQHQAQSSLPAPQWRRQVMWFGAETAWWHDTVQAHFDELAKWLPTPSTECSDKPSKKVKKSQNSQSCQELDDLSLEFAQRLKGGLACLGLSASILQQPIWQLSSGEKQRLALIRGLLLQPKVLLLDEVTANLDEQSSRQVEALIHAYIQQENTSRCALWVTHDSQQSQRVSNDHFQLTAEGVRNNVL